MKSVATTLVFIFLCTNVLSKEYDLIVKANGDSIACHIDSITTTHIYFIMKNNSEWVATHINIDQISNFQLNSIQRKSVHFKGGTSYIMPSDPQLPKKFAAKAGFGLAELLNIGFRFQSDNYKLGFSAGFIPSQDRTIYSFSGDLYLHLGHAWRAANKQPWCARTGLTYLREESEKYKDSYVLLTARAGKDVLLTKKLGLEFYFGLMFRIYYEHIVKESYWDLGMDFPVLPSVGIGIFYAF